ncbi:tyrosine-type recombinase/integrase [Streptomyces sp. TLI_185]|uniref:tyrosine-type recombinase/integrase n=1 Tax=Streptomyces sp. TLI_185 TaxID=2485151 RepID=UPI000F4EECE7
MERGQKAAGVSRKITPLWLRHFFASVGLAKGVPVTDMAVWLGHSDSRTTYQTYAHVLPDAPERLRSVLDDVLSLRTQLVLPLQGEALHETASPCWRDTRHEARPPCVLKGSSIE